MKTRRQVIGKKDRTKEANLALLREKITFQAKGITGGRLDMKQFLDLFQEVMEGVTPDSEMWNDACRVCVCVCGVCVCVYALCVALDIAERCSWLHVPVADGAEECNCSFFFY